jgi:hypothetical protein
MGTEEMCGNIKEGGISQRESSQRKKAGEKGKVKATTVQKEERVWERQSIPASSKELVGTESF